jgi:pimeloyl-ACP methyl ester carboxylesterase
MRSPVLYLHGFGLDGQMWAAQIAALESKHQGLTVDLPPTTRGLLDILDARGFDRVHVVGHSLGGAVAADLALAFPHRVRTLVLVNALMRGRDPGVAAKDEASTTFESAEPPPLARFAELRIPTLVVVGENDAPASRAMSDEYAATIPNARKVVLPGAGHMPSLETPDAFSAALSTFFSE